MNENDITTRIAGLPQHSTYHNLEHIAKERGYRFFTTCETSQKTMPKENKEGILIIKNNGIYYYVKGNEDHYEHYSLEWYSDAPCNYVKTEQNEHHNRD